MQIPFSNPALTVCNYPVRATPTTEVTFIDGLGYVVRPVWDLADDIIKGHADTYTFETLMRTDPRALQPVNPSILPPSENSVINLVNHINNENTLE